MDHADQSDERLMQRVARGERDALSVLVRRYASGLLTFVRRMSGDHHRSEELFQDVFLAIWTGRRRYRFPRPFRSWLFGIAANKCRADYRSRSGSPAWLETPAAAAVFAGDPSPLEGAIATETAALVEQAVLELPPQQRQVVVLKVWNGLSYAEIAEAIGRTESTVRSNMFHALASLRKYLEPRMS